MTRFEDAIEEALDLPSTSIPSMATKPIIKENSQEGNLKSQDYEYARENLYKVIESGHDALDNMLAIAKSSEHPRAFEVVNQIMKTMADAQKDLLELKKKQQQITGENNQQPQNVTNALFVGSTAELQKMIKGRD
jgi:predicted transcriptional regulator